MDRNLKIKTNILAKQELSAEFIQTRILMIRGLKVMLDTDLAALYGVPTRRLKEQVRRNLKRFPQDFMFELTWDEVLSLPSRSQNATLNKGESVPLRSQFAILKKGRNVKYLPYVFIEQGVAMLSSVINSDRAIEVNIQIMRAFTKLREFMASHKDLVRKIEDLERKFGEHDKKFVVVFEAIKQLLEESTEPDVKKEPISFHVRR